MRTPDLPWFICRRARRATCWLSVLLPCLMLALVHLNADRRPPRDAPVEPLRHRVFPTTPQSSGDVTPDGTRGCASLRRPSSADVVYSNGVWQTLVEGSAEIYLYSAFYDDRPVVGELPYVRILALTRNTPNELFCRLWYDETEAPLVTRAEKLVTGRGERLRGSPKFHQLLFSCRLRAARPAPSHVTVATSRCAANSTLYLPVQVSARAPYEVEFGVCVAIAYGKVPHAAFVEWMEFNRLLGVGEFNVYNGSMSAEMGKVFGYYADKGLLSVIQLPPPIDDRSVLGTKLASPASLNDCMMRNWYRYRYVVIVDFDEVIVPRLHDNYTAMLGAIDAAHRLTAPHRSYTFRNAYYFSNLPADERQPAYLRTMRHRRRAPPSRFLFTPKSFIDPRTCLSAFNHYCYRRFASLGRPWTIDVSAALATNNHYRKCGFGRAKCEAMYNRSTIDDDILRFEPELDRRVRRVFKELGLDYD